MGVTVKHPAKFSEPVLDRIGHLLDLHGWPRRVLDPFAGIGRIHHLTTDPELARPWFTVGVEIEGDWAHLHPRNLIGDALTLPFRDNAFDGLITSPCYGNRFSDHHNAQDGSVRRSYTHDIGHPLHERNAGKLQWGQKYRLFHERAWTECLRVLQPGALIVVNVSNLIRGGVEQPVTEWHLHWFLEHDCQIVDLDRVNTARMRYGVNRQARARFENVFIVRYQPT